MTRAEQLRARVADDGTIENREIETYLAEVSSHSQIDFVNQFVAIIVDNGPTDLEVRLGFEAIEQFASAIRKPPSSLRAS